MDQTWLNEGLPFRKMHGLGNDFVVVDARGRSNPITPDLATAIGDRHFGVGFDQLAVILDDPEAAAFLQFWNADGSLSAACGNATRCIAGLLFAETDAKTLTLRTDRGFLPAENLGSGRYAVNMGTPQLSWREIPLARDVDPMSLPIEGSPVALGMGNPHAVFFTDDLPGADILTLGPRIETHSLYPERTNVELVEVLNTSEIRLKIWERGVGLTLASGSCSCAATVASNLRNRTGRAVKVHVDGGTLDIDWRDDGVWMAGPTAHVMDGTFTAEFLAAFV